MKPVEQDNRKRSILKLSLMLLPVLLFVYLFGLNMTHPLEAPDLWWHLKTGEYIVANWEVPDVDPFAFTTPRPLGEVKKMGLRAHWLGQVILYLPYKAAGLAGVAAMRGALILLPMAILYVWLLRRRAGPWLTLAVVSMPALMLTTKLGYTFERPQGISFTLALVLVMLLLRGSGPGLRIEPAKEGP